MKNTGGQDGTFETDVAYRTAQSDWKYWNQPIQLFVPAGESRTWTSGELYFNIMTTATYRFEAIQKSFEVDIVSKKLSFGQAYTLGERFQLIIASLDFQQTYDYSSGGRTYSESAGEGRKWAIAKVWAKNISGSIESVPTKFELALVAGNKQYDYYTYYKSSNEYSGAMSNRVSFVKEK
ncbi:hypothetical protein VB779_08730 [Haloarculaceae archaeon H-GB11]|nr:hypothetical protein [Haloarculaceae archaeon H-GB11]